MLCFFVVSLSLSGLSFSSSSGGGNSLSYAALFVKKIDGIRDDSIGIRYNPECPECYNHEWSCNSAPELYESYKSAQVCSISSGYSKGSRDYIPDLKNIKSNSGSNVCAQNDYYKEVKDDYTYDDYGYNEEYIPNESDSKHSQYQNPVSKSPNKQAIRSNDNSTDRLINRPNDCCSDSGGESSGKCPEYEIPRSKTTRMETVKPKENLFDRPNNECQSESKCSEFEISIPKSKNKQNIKDKSTDKSTKKENSRNGSNSKCTQKQISTKSTNKQNIESKDKSSNKSTDKCSYKRTN